MAENLPIVADPPHPSRNPVDQSIAWIGFRTEVNRNSIRDEGGLEAFDYFVDLTESNIRYITSGFSKRTTAQVRINFGMQRVKYTLGIIQWNQYERRWYHTESLTGITNDDK